MGLVLVGVLFLAGAGQREAARTATGSGATAAVPDGEITPGVAHADVDTFDLQLD